ncbi:MAG: helicase HerA-like domain-containing protein [Nitratireductor sp.]
MLQDGQIYLGTSRKPDDSMLIRQYMILKYANRHGLITGATGTGKTVSLQILAEGFSQCRRSRFLRRREGSDLSRP